jgi:hypothetical protein
MAGGLAGEEVGGIVGASPSRRKGAARAENRDILLARVRQSC